MSPNDLIAFAGLKIGQTLCLFKIGAGSRVADYAYDRDVAFDICSKKTSLRFVNWNFVSTEGSFSLRFPVWREIFHKNQVGE